MEKVMCFTARDPAPACFPAPQRCCGECTYALDDADSCLDHSLQNPWSHHYDTTTEERAEFPSARGEQHPDALDVTRFMGISKSPPCPASSVPKIMHWLAEQAAKQDLDAKILKAGERLLTCPRQQRLPQSSVGTSPRYPLPRM